MLVSIRERFTMATKRRKFTPEFKGRIVVEVLKEEKDVNTIAAEHDLNPNLVRKWRQEFIDHPERVFDEGRRKADEEKEKELLRDERDEMLKTIGTLTLEKEWLQQKCLKYGSGEEPPRYRP